MTSKLFGASKSVSSHIKLQQSCLPHRIGRLRVWWCKIMYETMASYMVAAIIVTAVMKAVVQAAAGANLRHTASCWFHLIPSLETSSDLLLALHTCIWTTSVLRIFPFFFLLSNEILQIYGTGQSTVALTLLHFPNSISSTLHWGASVKPKQRHHQAQTPSLSSTFSHNHPKSSSWETQLWALPWPWINTTSSPLNGKTPILTAWELGAGPWSCASSITHRQVHYEGPRLPILNVCKQADT